LLVLVRRRWHDPHLLLLLRLVVLLHRCMPQDAGGAGDLDEYRPGLAVPLHGKALPVLLLRGLGDHDRHAVVWRVHSGERQWLHGLRLGCRGTGENLSQTAVGEDNDLGLRAIVMAGGLRRGSGAVCRRRPGAGRRGAGVAVLVAELQLGDEVGNDVGEVRAEQVAADVDEAAVLGEAAALAAVEAAQLLRRAPHNVGGVRCEQALEGIAVGDGVHGHGDVVELKGARQPLRAHAVRVHVAVGVAAGRKGLRLLTKPQDNGRLRVDLMALQGLAAAAVKEQQAEARHAGACRGLGGADVLQRDGELAAERVGHHHHPAGRQRRHAVRGGVLSGAGAHRWFLHR